MENIKEVLRALIQGESEAISLYTIFAKRAKDEGLSRISILFDALVMAERIHIKNHIRALGEEFIPLKNNSLVVGTTLENIRTAITGEVEENKKLYPSYIKRIKKECSSDYGKVARLSMTWAKNVENEHAKLLKKAYKALKSGKDFKFESIALCQVCGNIVLNKKDTKECSICGHDHIFFETLREGISENI